MITAVTGATGFIGRHLVRHLLDAGHEVRALTRREPPSDMMSPRLKWIVGDMHDPAAWTELLAPGCTVFNLAYSVANVSNDAVRATMHIADSLASGRVSRFVHCSTVSVYGRISEDIVTETTECHPRNDYGETKLAIEKSLIDNIAGRFECAILRPSTVFGEGGVALTKEAADLLDGSPFFSHLRAALFGKRRAHLVPVETVAAALLYLAQTRLDEPVEVFIISDDDEPANNFIGVERILRDELSVRGWPIPLPLLPRGILEALLYFKGRANVNSRVVYSPEKLLSRGFVRPVAFEPAIRQYIRDHRSSLRVGSGK